MTTTSDHVFVPPAPDPEQYMKKWEEQFGESLTVIRIQCKCIVCMTYPALKGSGIWNVGGSCWEFANNEWRRY